MRIEQLKDFIEIAESSSLSAAAKKLFVTPQALSASLGKMENEVGLSCWFADNSGSN